MYEELIPNRGIPDLYAELRGKVDMSLVCLTLKPAYVPCQYQTRSLNEPLNSYVKNLRKHHALRNQQRSFTDYIFQDLAQQRELQRPYKGIGLKITRKLEPIRRDNTNMVSLKRNIYRSHGNTVVNTLKPLQFTTSAKKQYGNTFSSTQRGLYRCEVGPARNVIRLHKNTFSRACLEPLNVSLKLPKGHIAKIPLSNMPGYN